MVRELIFLMPGSSTYLSTVMPDHSADSSWLAQRGWFWSLLFIVTLWKTFAASRLGLIFDECYYWEWSLHPQASYYDHPPLTAWLIASGHTLLGQSTLAVRCWAILSGVLLALSGRWLAWEMFGQSAANRAGIFLLMAPIFAGNALLMTPDTFLMPAWAIAVLCAWKGSRDRATYAWWLAAGAAAGIGMLSKYTMVLYFVALGFFWLLSPGKRIRLFLGVTLATLVSLVLFSPVLWWNSQHQWVSFHNQMRHGFYNEHHSLINFQNLANYTTFLIILVSPLLGLFCFRSAATRLYDERYRFLALFYWTVVLFFAFSAAKAHIEANWPMTAFVTGLIMVAADWDQYGKAWRRAAVIFLLVADGGAVLGVSYLTLPRSSAFAVQNLTLNTEFLQKCLAPFPHAEDLVASAERSFHEFQGRMEEFLGPEQVAHAVVEEFHKSGADFLCVSSYQFAGVIAFYAPELEPVMWLPNLGRYRFPWINDSLWGGKTALSVEWPGTGPEYNFLFKDFSPLSPRKLPQSNHPILLSLGKNYLPKKVNYHPPR